jgi:hypothetical protein
LQKGVRRAPSELTYLLVPVVTFRIMERLISNDFQPFSSYFSDRVFLPL